MNKKSLVKWIAFVCGLYFALDYVLPEKIGGAFDQYEIRDLAVLPEPSGGYSIWYAGFFRQNSADIGEVSIDAAGVAAKSRKPVLTRGVLNQHDQRGFSRLEAVSSGGTDQLFYLGRTPSSEDVLCRATKTNGAWEKSDRPVIVKRLAGVDASAESAVTLAEAPTAYAVLPDGSEGLRLFVGGRFKVGERTESRVLAGRSKDGGEWVLDYESLALPGVDPVIEITAIEAVADGESVLLFVRQNSAGSRLYRLSGGAIEALGEFTFPETVDSFALLKTPDGLRGWFGMAKSLDEAPTDESSRSLTWIAAGSSNDGLTWTITPETAETAEGLTGAVATAGRRGQPTYLSRFSAKAGQSLEIIGALSLGLAIVNLFLLHGGNIAKRRGGVHNSLAFFAMFILMFLYVYNGKYVDETADTNDATPAAQASADATTEGDVAEQNLESEAAEVAADQAPEGEATAQTADTESGDAASVATAAVDGTGRKAPPKSHWKRGYDILFNCVQYPMQVAVFSMITFYLISSAYRAFRVKSFEAGLMMVSAVIVMLGGVPLGAWLTHWLPEPLEALSLPAVREKLLYVANSAAYRGVLFGMLVGGLALSLRMWLGIEDSMYRGVD